MTEGPSINVDEFRHRPVNEIAAILPNKEAVKAAIKDLQTANVDVSTIRVLHGQRVASVPPEWPRPTAVRTYPSRLRRGFCRG
jgi:hypothetical protein